MRTIYIRIIFGLIFLAGFFYILIPVPTSIDSFPSQSGSAEVNPLLTKKLTNVHSYFVDSNQQQVAAYYRSLFKQNYCDSFSILNLFCKVNPILLPQASSLVGMYLPTKAHSTFLYNL